jgi:hypothetical protein
MLFHIVTGYSEHCKELTEAEVSSEHCGVCNTKSRAFKPCVLTPNHGTKCAGTFEHFSVDEKASGKAELPSVTVMSRLIRQQVASVFVYRVDQYRHYCASHRNEFVTNTRMSIISKNFRGLSLRLKPN